MKPQRKITLIRTSVACDSEACKKFTFESGSKLEEQIGLSCAVSSL
ncbi:hypothetical protein CLOSTMETH_02831 [[Clostridium] methylpentosum DSM 5476]|uniref:Uncharacterized protein n=1 Tax=[Clostridium] methylpentosum DSM 5476 TaxID=537013 RepID=C0EG39_9FIRM|nr:hypothetical protein CLOSTMETH_02831 [[Clostridium] methylpentosum DSM 5476]